MISSEVLIISVAIALLTLALLSFSRWILIGEKQSLSQRLSDVVPDKNAHVPELPQIVQSDDLSQIPFLNRVLQKMQVSKNLNKMLEQADLSIKVGELVLWMMVCGGIGLVFTARSGNFLLIFLAVVAFSLLPLFYIMYRRGRRIKLFEEQFPDALDMMSNAIRAGFALNRAMQLVANEAPDPVGIEFRRTFEEINLGLPVKDAFMNLTRRIDSVDLKLFVTAMLVQRESGGNLTEILTKISTTIRARFKLLGQIKVFTAQGRFSAWILGTLPIALGFMVYMMNPDYVMLLFQETLGHIFVAIGLILQICGFFVIRKIVQVKIQ